ncbi:glycosyltransferase [Aerococcaceae bacterium WGS1372]
MDAPVLLSLSRLSKEKSLDELIMSFPAIKKVYPEAHLVIVGDGPYRETLETLVKGYELDHVHFVGEINHNEVNEYYQMADLYINASESESQGLTYLESIANRLPIVAKENDYLNQIVKSGEFGQLYPPNGSLHSTVINYLNKKQTGDIKEIDMDLLESISAKQFGKNVGDFYQELVDSSNLSPNNFFERVISDIRKLKINS